MAPVSHTQAMEVMNTEEMKAQATQTKIAAPPAEAKKPDAKKTKVGVPESKPDPKPDTKKDPEKK